MKDVWIVVSVVIFVFFVINPKKGYYYIFPLIILMPPISRFLYSIAGSGETNILNSSVYILNLLYFILSFGLVIKNWSKLRKLDRVILSYVIYSLFMMVIGFISSDTRVAFIAFLNTVIPLHFYFIPRFININLRKMISLILICMSIFMLWEAYQAAFGYFPWEYKYSEIRSEKVIESMGKSPFGYEASFPAAMLFSLVLVSTLLGSAKYYDIKKIHIITIILFFVVVLERTPLAAMVISSFATIFLWGSQNRKLGMRIFAVLAVVFISFFFTNIILPRLDTLNVREKRLSELSDIQNATNLQARINRWEKGITFITSPIVIVGYGLGFYAGDLSYSTHRGMHNELYNQIIEYGFIGLLLLIMVYFNIARAINSQNKNILLPFFAGILTFWIIAMVNSPFLNNSKYFHWFFVGCIAVTSTYNDQKMSLRGGVSK